MRRITITAITLVALAAGWPSLGAQTPRSGQPAWPSARQMLDHFDRVSRGELRGNLNAMATVFNEPETFRPAVVDSLLDGLQERAISEGNAQVQIAALGWLASAGRGSVHAPIPGVARRLAVVHERASSVQVRRSAVRHLGSLGEQREAAQSLRAIAMQDSARERAPGAAHDAVWALTHLGRPGGDVLRELHARGLVRESRARTALRQVAVQRGWQRASPGENR